MPEFETNRQTPSFDLDDVEIATAVLLAYNGQTRTVEAESTESYDRSTIRRGGTLVQKRGSGLITQRHPW